ncbi:hypothetical protein DP353_03355 [Shigella flexneri]|nr:hypothetical protein [Shigella flexneri]EGD7450864.1 hypothetical protein [Shigella flexneri]EGD7971218.1 hypothetical protein [Shigella flexneri]EGD8345271.1 hypothetical protein [Shigella flexneri]EGE0498287.1 hypothetical protein [Shigella flexneri]
MPIMQAKEKSSYQTEDEKRGNDWKYLRIRRSLKECLMRRLTRLIRPTARTICPGRIRRLYRIRQCTSINATSNADG